MQTCRACTHPINFFLRIFAKESNRPGCCIFLQDLIEADADKTEFAEVSNLFL